MLYSTSLYPAQHLLHISISCLANTEHHFYRTTRCKTYLNCYDAQHHPTPPYNAKTLLYFTRLHFTITVRNFTIPYHTKQLLYLRFTSHNTAKPIRNYAGLYNCQNSTAHDLTIHIQLLYITIHIQNVVISISCIATPHSTITIHY